MYAKMTNGCITSKSQFNVSCNDKFIYQRCCDILHCVKTLSWCHADLDKCIK